MESITVHNNSVKTATEVPVLDNVIASIEGNTSRIVELVVVLAQLAGRLYGPEPRGVAPKNPDAPSSALGRLECAIGAQREVISEAHELLNRLDRLA